MPLDIAAVQASLAAAGLDGWLLYDFHGSNPIAQSLAGLVHAAKMTTRRWYYFIPAQGEPRGLVHAIERHNLDGLPGTMHPYAGRRSLDEGLDALLAGASRIAMEYSPGCNIPYLSRVDAGTLESVRGRGVEVVSSGDLVQQFEAVWSPTQIATHDAASDALYRIKDRAFDVLRQVAAGVPTTEYALQQQMVGWFADEGLVSSDPPVVAVMANAGNPHYLPTASSHQPIGRDQLVLLDLWGKQGVPGAVYADITWVAYTGAGVPAEMARAFDAIARARDTAVATRPGGPGRGPLRPRVRGRSRRAGGAPGGRVRGRDPASHRPQPRGKRPWQWRPPRRLRDARRTAVAAGIGVHDRTGPLFSGVRGPHRDQCRHHGNQGPRERARARRPSPPWRRRRYGDHACPHARPPSSMPSCWRSPRWRSAWSWPPGSTWRRPPRRSRSRPHRRPTRRRSPEASMRRRSGRSPATCRQRSSTSGPSPPPVPRNSPSSSAATTSCAASSPTSSRAAANGRTGVSGSRSRRAPAPGSSSTRPRA